ncbi:dihydroorotate dehydrogenase electron transfer subunit [Spirochaetota bacterium]
MAKLISKPKKISTDHYLLRIEHNKSNSSPGQFINIKAGEGTEPLLRRPFSIFNHDGNLIEIIIKSVGKGTKILCGSQPGTIDILGPLGKGFTLVENKKVLLAGGGVGNAPLYYLSRKLKELNNTIYYIYGSQSKEYIYLEEMYEPSTDNFIITTDNGTKGKRGFTTDIAGELLGSEKIDMVYTCGPSKMMMKMASLVNDNTEIEVSLETYFGCGIGLCVGCTVETSEGLKRACYDGPVMNGKTLKWDSLHKD